MHRTKFFNLTFFKLLFSDDLTTCEKVRRLGNYIKDQLNGKALTIEQKNNLKVRQNIPHFQKKPVHTLQ